MDQLTVGDSGIYRCLADNEVTQERVRSSFITLQIEGQRILRLILGLGAVCVCVCVCNLYFVAQLIHVFSSFVET